MSIELNRLETVRFGVVAARVSDDAASPEAIDAAASLAGVEMLTVRIPVTNLPRVHAFENAGYQLMDTLLYYGRKLDDLSASTTGTGPIRCRPAVPDDVKAVGEVSRKAFAGYFGHYHADPRLDRGAADAAYVEWAETSILNCSSDAPALVAEENAQLIGFLTLRLNGAEELDLVLSGVDPAFNGRGVYGTLIREALALAKAKGCSRVITSTQINNYAVQKVWSKLGLVHVRSVYTFHKWLT